MDTLITLQNFLYNIGPVSTANYQIRDASGNLVYTTTNDPDSRIDSEILSTFSLRTMGHNSFTYDLIDPDMFLCGCPVPDNSQTQSLLLSYGQMRNAATLEEHRRQMESHLTSAVALAIEKTDSQAEVEELAQQLEHSFEDLYLYDRISSQIKSLHLSERMLHNLIVEIVENMQVDAAFVTLPLQSEYNMQIVRPETSNRLKDMELFLSELEALARPHIDSAEDNYFILNDSREIPDCHQLAPIPFRFLMVGVRHQQQLFGWLGLVAFNMNEIFRQGELRMLKAMAEQLAIVIANTDLYADLEQFTINMVSSLVSAIEAKDAYTRGHSERVHRFSMLLARSHGLKGDALEALKWAAILHDVGKIGVPENILLKPGKLTDEEFSRIKEHPEKGHTILKPVAQLSPSLGGILHHHERYDGKGYPNGLSGENIPLAARIIAVADTFDAITSSRPYRSSKSPDEAMAIIESVAGSQLDPNIVALFKKVYPTAASVKIDRSQV